MSLRRTIAAVSLSAFALGGLAACGGDDKDGRDTAPAPTTSVQAVAIPTAEELSALLATDRVIPVVHGITYEELRDESPLLASRSGLSTGEDTLEQVAVKIANAVRPEAN